MVLVVPMVLVLPILPTVPILTSDFMVPTCPAPAIGFSTGSYGPYGPYGPMPGIRPWSPH
eukprot:3210419-Karenia_brevis.AAC.1